MFFQYLFSSQYFPKPRGNVGESGEMLGKRFGKGCCEKANGRSGAWRTEADPKICRKAQMSRRG